jgi:hypothetical protein
MELFPIRGLFADRLSLFAQRSILTTASPSLTATVGAGVGHGRRNESSWRVTAVRSTLSEPGEGRGAGAGGSVGVDKGEESASAPSRKGSGEAADAGRIGERAGDICTPEASSRAPATHDLRREVMRGSATDRAMPAFLCQHACLSIVRTKRQS